MKPGERVQARVSAANFDPALFAAPFDVIIRRRSNFHFTYGARNETVGRYCMGAALARMMIKVTTRTILDQHPRGLAWDGNPVQRIRGIVNSIPAGEHGLHLSINR